MTDPYILTKICGVAGAALFLAVAFPVLRKKPWCTP